jgi:ABC-type branched-subunit amino acid transport system substrate-binding protein
MTRVSSARLLAALVAGSFLVAACSSDSSGSTSTAADTTTAGTGGPDTTAGADTTAAETTAPEATTWAVNTDDCIDPAAAEAPIESTIKIGSAMPLSGNGPAVAAFAPVKAGFETYIKYANEKKLLGDLKIEATIEDDQYNKDLTPGAVSKQIDAGVNLFAGIIGSANNAAVRDTLNEECIPQLNALSGSPAWGDVANHPWTTGLLVPYTVESKVYAKQLAELYPNGAKVALFYVNNEFGQVYADAFKELAPDYKLEIVDEQTIEAGDNSVPASQITSIASKKPDVVMAVPLGAGCVTFLTGLADAKAQNAGWTPSTFITNTCASSLILGTAGAAADGLYTSGNLKDITAPSNASDPAVKEYLDYMKANDAGDIAATAAAGWTAAEVTIAMLKQAQDSPDGLSRASIINAARNFTYTPMLAREGVVDTMNGEADPFLAESLQVLQYAAGPATFTDIGSLITEFETK